MLAVYDVGDLEQIKKYNAITLDGDGRITFFEEKPKNPTSTLTGIALYFYPKSTLPLIRQYIAEGNNPDQPGRLIQWLYPRAAGLYLESARPLVRHRLARKRSKRRTGSLPDADYPRCPASVFLSSRQGRPPLGTGRTRRGWAGQSPRQRVRLGQVEKAEEAGPVEGLEEGKEHQRQEQRQGDGRERQNSDEACPPIDAALHQAKDDKRRRDGRPGQHRPDCQPEQKADSSKPAADRKAGEDQGQRGSQARQRQQAGQVRPEVKPATAVRQQRGDKGQQAEPRQYRQCLEERHDAMSALQVRHQQPHRGQPNDEGANSLRQTQLIVGQQDRPLPFPPKR